MESAAESCVPRLPAEGDERLWQRSLSGDGEAFGRLFDRHQNRVFQHACRLAQTRHDAEDVTAAAFLELWRRRENVRLVDGSVVPWLLVTATNLARNSARGVRRYRQLLARLPRTQAPADAAADAIDSHVLGVDPRLLAGLRSLSRIDAQLFALVALGGYGVRDAAQVLDLSVPAARTRLHRARSRLRAQFIADPLPSGAHRDGDREHP